MEPLAVGTKHKFSHSDVHPNDDISAAAVVHLEMQFLSVGLKGILANQSAHDAATAIRVPKIRRKTISFMLMTIPLIISKSNMVKVNCFTFASKFN
jgi:hypothetical protein